uniref:Uncharacterized protein n=1 Tax=Rhizophora mucronata TaxID=61149 RepID=A0A2P2QFZ5_RHIMU
MHLREKNYEELLLSRSRKQHTLVTWTIWKLKIEQERNWQIRR